MDNSIPLTNKDFPEKDHWGHAWKSPSNEWSLTMSSPPEVGYFLYGLVRAFKPSFCIETGTHKGLSALFIGSALRDNNNGHLTTIDMEDHGQAQRIRDRGMGGEWVDCVISKSLDYNPEGKRIDFLFLDASHGSGPITEEFYHFKPYLTGGSIICVDDCRTNPTEIDGMNNLIRDNDLEGFHLLTSRGMFVAKYGKGHEIHDESRNPFFRSLKNFCK